MFNSECNAECLQPEVPVATQQYHEISKLPSVHSVSAPSPLLSRSHTVYTLKIYFGVLCVVLFSCTLQQRVPCFLQVWGARLPQQREAFYRMLDFWCVGMKGRRYTTVLGCDFFTADAERLNKNRRDSYQLSLCLFLCHPRHHLLPHRAPVSPPPMPYLFIYNLTFPSPFFCRCNLINNLNVISVWDPKVLKSCKKGDKTFF